MTPNFHPVDVPLVGAAAARRHRDGRRRRAVELRRPRILDAICAKQRRCSRRDADGAGASLQLQGNEVQNS